MKTLKFTVLILTMLIVNSCDKDKDESTQSFPIGTSYPFFQHMIFISFQNVSGNDLLKNTEFVWSINLGMRDTVKPEFYTLDILFEDGIPNPWKPEPKPYVIYDVNYPRLYLAEGWLSSSDIAISDYKYLWFNTSSYKFTGLPEALLYGWETKECDFAEKIIFRFTCSYLFGDNEAHDIGTWWKPYKYKDGKSSIYAVCYRIEFGGKEITVDVFENAAVATIVLDR